MRLFGSFRYFGQIRWGNTSATSDSVVYLIHYSLQKQFVFISVFSDQFSFESFERFEKIQNIEEVQKKCGKSGNL